MIHPHSGEIAAAVLQQVHRGRSRRYGRAPSDLDQRRLIDDKAERDIDEIAGGFMRASASASIKFSSSSADSQTDKIVRPEHRI